MNVGVYGQVSNPAVGFAGYFAGNVFTTGTYQPSDARLKSNIGASAGLSELLALHPIAFDWRAESLANDGVRHQGLLAQEVQAVLPELVRIVDSPGSVVEEQLAVNYTELIPVLVRAIQEQQAQIEVLRAALESLRAGN
jgi:hypothetical protein